MKEIIAIAHNTKPNKITEEKDIVNQGQAIQNLIKEGLWPSPGGAWCSAGIPIFDKMWANQVENEKLSSLRDTLLPKLMSGELDVSNIDL